MEFFFLLEGVDAAVKYSWHLGLRPEKSRQPLLYAVRSLLLIYSHRFSADNLFMSGFSTHVETNLALIFVVVAHSAVMYRLNGRICGRESGHMSAVVEGDRILSAVYTYCSML